MIRLAVVDDHPFVRLGIQRHFSPHADITIVASAADPSALETPEQGFDVLLTDLYLSESVTALDSIARWSATAAVLTMSYSGRTMDVIAAVRAGAKGYLVKDASPEAFVRAVREVAHGGFAWSAGLAEIVQQWLGPPTGSKPGVLALSVRECEVLGYLAKGLTHRQIATRLTVAQTTVDTYVKRIRTKLKLGNKAELTRCAIELGLTSGAPENQP